MEKVSNSCKKIIPFILPLVVLISLLVLGPWRFATPVEPIKTQEKIIEYPDNRNSLFPVVVGALIGIIGSVVGGVTLFRLQSGHERRVFKRSKLEELVSFAYECGTWLDQLMIRYLLQGDVSVIERYPMPRIKMLQTLYFPTLKKEVETLSCAVEHFRKLIISQRIPLRKTKKYTEQFETQFDPKQKAVSDAIQALAQKAVALNI